MAVVERVPLGLSLLLDALAEVLGR